MCLLYMSIKLKSYFYLLTHRYNRDYFVFLSTVMETEGVTIPSRIPSSSLSDMLCDPTDLIWRKGTPFEAMTGRTAPSSDGVLAEVFWGFTQL